MQGYTLQNTKFKKETQTIWNAPKYVTFTTDQKEYTEGVFRETKIEAYILTTKKFHKLYTCGSYNYWVVINGNAHLLSEICFDYHRIIDHLINDLINNMTAKEKETL